MREHLLGYLLGALEAEESRSVQEALERDENLRRDAERIQSHLTLLDWDRDPPAHPPGLATRTCARVFAEHHSVSRAHGALETNMAGDAFPRSRWSLTDLVVAAGICAAAAILFFPAIANSRFQAQLAVCQNNLRDAGRAMIEYDRLHGSFPIVPVSGNLSAAGIYAPVLRDGEYLTTDRALVCPGSEWAAPNAGFRVPHLDELSHANGDVLRKLKHMMGGSYGYTFGYVCNGKYLPVRNLGRANYVLLADTPNLNQPDRRSANHGGKGQNVFCENGSIKYLVECALGDCQNRVFVSDRGLVEPGRSENDVVVGASDESPYLLP